MTSVWTGRLAEVWASPGHAGAGVVVGREGVLTARHVLADALTDDGGRILARVVRAGEQTAGWVPMKCPWNDQKWDLALLTVDHELPEDPKWVALREGTEPVVVQLGASAERGCEAVGFPAMAVQRAAAGPSRNVRQPEQVVGTVAPSSLVKRPRNPKRPMPPRLIPLDVTDTRLPETDAGWGGISGAGVVLPAGDDRLIGIVVIAEVELQHKRLYLVPLADALRCAPGFADALGALTGRQSIAEVRHARRFEAVCLDECLGPDKLPRRIADLTDLAAFGVKPADLPGESTYLNYVPRDYDQQLRAKLEQARAEGRMLLVVGSSAAGKSRSTAEAARKLLGDYRLVRPRDEDALAHVLDLPLAELGPTVVWLDDAQKYASTSLHTTIERMSHRGLIVISTIRQAELDELTPRGDVRNPAGEALTDPRLVVRASCKLAWSNDERTRVKDLVSNEDLLEAVEKGIPVGVYCVAGREMVTKFQDSRNDEDHPFNFWLVRTVLDWYRTGIAQPIPAREAERLMASGGGCDDEMEESDFPDARDWAIEPIIGKRRRTRQSMLTYHADAQTLAVHDYLHDYDQRNNTDPLADHVWDAVLDYANGGTRIRIALVAVEMRRSDIAVRAVRPLKEKGDPVGAVVLGVLLEEQGDVEGAKAAYQIAIDSRDADMAPSAAFNLGLLLWRQGDVDGAKIAYQTSIDSHHADWSPGAAVNLGNLLAEQGDVDDAKTAYQTAIDSHNAEWSPNAAVVLGVLLAEQGDVEGAKAAYQTAIDFHHADIAPNAAFGLGLLLAEQGDVDGAKTAYQTAIDSHNADIAPRAAFNLGVLLAGQGDVDGAKTAYQTAIDSDHTDWSPNAAFGLGLFLEEQGDVDGAKIAYQTAIDSHNADIAPRAAVVLGVLLAEQGDVDGAKIAYQTAIDSHHADWSPNAAVVLGVLLAEQGDVDGAKIAYQTAIDSHHADWSPNAAVVLGVLLAEQGDVDDAKIAYQTAIDSHHTDWSPNAAGNLGNLLAEQGDVDGAKTAYQTAIDSHHADWSPGAAVKLGNLLAEQGDVDGAKTAYQTAIDSHHTDWSPNAAFGLGLLLAEQGDVDGAKTAHQTAIDSHHADWSPGAAIGLGVLLAEQGDVDGAKTAYQTAIDSHHADWSPGAAIGLGVLLAEQGDVDGAKTAYQTAIDSHHADWSPNAAVNLGNLLAEQGDVDGAKTAYQTAIDSHHTDWSPNAAFGLGVLLAEQGDVDGAKTAHQTAIDSHHADWSPGAAVKLGNLLAEQGDVDGA